MNYIINSHLVYSLLCLYEDIFCIDIVVSQCTIVCLKLNDDDDDDDKIAPTLYAHVLYARCDILRVNTSHMNIFRIIGCLLFQI